MDPLIGAAIAVAAAWLSILLAVQIPWRPPIQGLRRSGAAALTLVAAMVWGLPIPAWSPLAVLVIGVGWSSLAHRSSL